MFMNKDSTKGCGMEKENIFEGQISGYTKDYADFKKYLEVRGIDSDRYKPVGGTITHGQNLPTMIDIVCLDVEKSRESTEKFVSLSFLKDDSIDDFFNVFGRINFRFALKNYDLNDIQIVERLVIDKPAPVEKSNGHPPLEEEG